MKIINGHTVRHPVLHIMQCYILVTCIATAIQCAYSYTVLHALAACISYAVLHTTVMLTTCGYYNSSYYFNLKSNSPIVDHLVLVSLAAAEINIIYLHLPFNSKQFKTSLIPSGESLPVLGIKYEKPILQRRHRLSRHLSPC